MLIVNPDENRNPITPHSVNHDLLEMPRVIQSGRNTFIFILNKMPLMQTVKRAHNVSNSQIMKAHCNLCRRKNVQFDKIDKV